MINIDAVEGAVTCKSFIFSRIRSNQKHILKNEKKEIPFVLAKENDQIQVVDPLSADILDMQTISDVFEPCKVDAVALQEVDIGKSTFFSTYIIHRLQCFLNNNIHFRFQKRY